MKFSEQWLREWVNPKLTTAELAEQLTMVGLEVDAVVPAAGEITGVVVGLAKKVERHPNADKLSVCQVDVGQAELLNIVCGAANIRSGIKVPVAMIGAALPGNFKIKNTTLRGVASQGMICSEKELGMAEESAGIMVLPHDAPIGQNVTEYLMLNDQVIDVDLTPNRGDCLSIKGLAREIAAFSSLNFQALCPDFHEVPEVTTERLPIQLAAPQSCPRYVGRIIKGIGPHAKTPIWLQERLRRSGIRSIHPVVDVTNYVMLELGQPMHGFDLTKINKEIIVRFATRGEKLTLLDGQTITLINNDLVIADAQQAIALAGVMGGANTAVDNQSVDIVLESAYFDPITIAETVQRYQLRSDSSHRFERGVDPEGQVAAIERATALLLEIVGGKPGPVFFKDTQSCLPTIKKILLRQQRIARILGIEMTNQQIVSILTALGMRVADHQDAWEVDVPPFRHDIEQEIDLIEELVRIYGYQHVPAKTLLSELMIRPCPESKLSIQKIMQCLVDRDFNEAVTYSFVDAALQQQIDPDHTAVKLVNPLSNDMSVMRTSLWPGLLNAARYNLHRQQQRIRLFEYGLCFIKEGETLRQRPRLGGLIMGDAVSEQWGEKPRQVDFFDMKNVAEALLSLTQRSDFCFDVCEHPALHPGQSACILYQEKIIGWLGRLHPQQQKKLTEKTPCYLFELDATVFDNKKIAQYQPVSKFPEVRRDIALIIDQDIPAARLIKKIAQTDKEILHKVQIFDIYQGEGIDSGQKSVALALTFVHPTRTLTDSEINAVMDRVIATAKTVFGAALRE